MFIFSGGISAQAALSSNPSGPNNDNGLPAEYVNSALFKESIAESVKKPSVKSEQEFEDELQLALAISQSEAEFSKQTKVSQKLSSSNSHSHNTQVSLLNQVNHPMSLEITVFNYQLLKHCP